MSRCFFAGCSHEGVDSHHIFPVEYGGPMDGRQVMLCATHHDRIHRTFNRVKAGKQSIGSIENSYERTLVEKINQQYTEFQTNGGIAPDARRRIVASLDEDEQKMVRVLKAHEGHSSIDKMLKHWIREKYERLTHGK